MNNTVKDYIQQLKYDNTKRRRLLAFICILSLVVAGGVSWNLHLKGVSMSNTACCGIEEHTHDENCGEEKVLICTLPGEEGHSHSEECYEQIITYLCDVTENEQAPLHTHTEECYTTEITYICTPADDTTEQQCTNTDENHVHDEACIQAEVPHVHDENCTVIQQVLVCEQTETVPHVHTGECGQTVENALVCELEETGHTHTDACYEIKPACGKDEHIHSLFCYSDPNADIESEEDWITTIPKPLSGNWNKDMVAVAYSQLGYTESENNFLVSEDGQTLQGYTRYGQWYGNPYGKWNGMFVSFCMNYTGIPGKAEEMNLFNSGANAMLAQWEIQGFIKPDEPEKGDLVFLDRDIDGICDDVAIISSSDGEGIKIIGADIATKSVAETELPQGVISYGSITKAFEKAVELGLALPVEEEIERDIDNGLFPAECPEGYTYYETTYGEGLYVEVYAPNEAFTDSVNLFASIYPEDTEEYENAVYQLVESGVANAAGNYIALDIHFANGEGAEVEPNAEAGTVYVRFVAHSQEAPPAPVIADFEYDIINADGSIAYCSTDIIEPPETIDTETVENETADNTQELEIMQLALFSELDEAPSDVQVFHISNEIISPISGSAASAGDEIYAEFTVESFSTFIIYNKDGTQVSTKNSLRDALNSAPSGATIKITAGGTVDAANQPPVLTAGKKITLDLNGQTLSFAGISAYPLIDVYGELTIIDSSTNQTGTLKGLGFNSQNATPVLKVRGGGKLYLKGGTITENFNSVAINSGSASPGGGIALVGSANSRAYFEMSGGTISNCKVSHTKVSRSVYGRRYGDDGDFAAGGAGVAASYADVVMTGGTITGCYALNNGGGMYLGNTSTLEMRGGTISNNTADIGGGGGICFGCGVKNSDGRCSVGTIYAGSIIDNKTLNTEHWGGGGIFVHTVSILTVYSPYIVNNYAKGFGGGMVSCPTGSNRLFGLNNAAIFDNKADGATYTYPSGDKSDDYSAYYASRRGHFSYYKDLYLPNGGKVYGTMLGGGSAEWLADGIKTTIVPYYNSVFTNQRISAGQTVTFDEGLQIGLTAYPTEEDKAKALAERCVIITGNSSQTHGGGIANNGIVILKGPTPEEKPYEFDFDKQVHGIDPYSGNPLTPENFTFTIERKDKNTYTLVSVVNSDSNGKVNVVISKDSLGTNPALPGTYQFRITEQADPSKTWIEYDENQYLYEVYLWEETTSRQIGGFTFLTTELKGNNAKWYKLNKATNKWELITGTPAFVNSTTGGLSVQKHFYIGSDEQFVTPDGYDGVFTLYEVTPSGDVQIGPPIPYSQFTNGSYTWTNIDPNKQYKITETGEMGTYAVQNASFIKVDGTNVVITDTTILQEIINHYEKTGKIKVKKQVPGTNPDLTPFEFTATLTTDKSGTPAPLANIDVYVTINGITTKVKTDPAGIFTFTLHKDETAEISNLPIGATIKLEEKTTGYTTEWTVPKNKTDKVSGTSATVVVTGETKEIICKNTPGVILPKTGGIGREAITLLGLAITLTALNLLKKKRS